MQTILDEFMNIPSAWEKLLGTVRKKRKGLQEKETKQSQTGEVLHHLLSTESSAHCRHCQHVGRALHKRHREIIVIPEDTAHVRQKILIILISEDAAHVRQKILTATARV